MVNAMSGVGQVADEVYVARMEAAAAATDAGNAIGTVQTIAVSFSVPADSTATKAVGVMEERV